MAEQHDRDAAVDLARSLYPYAPDPDADFNAGVNHGYQLGLRAPSPIRWEHKQVRRPVELVKLALAILAIIGVTIAVVS